MLTELVFCPFGLHILQISCDNEAKSGARLDKHRQCLSTHLSSNMTSIRMIDIGAIVARLEYPSEVWGTNSQP